MATNILALPQLAGGAAADGGTPLPAQFVVVRNGDWRDQIAFVQPPPNGTTPLDLSGIHFHAQLRATVDGEDLLDLSTDNGLLVSGGTAGTLTWAVPCARPAQAPFGATETLPAGPYLMDIVATADGVTVNLCQRSGPAVVTVTDGITR